MGLKLEVSMVWIFNPQLQCTVVVFVTHFQRFVNGLDINVKTNTEFVNIVVAKYLLLDWYSEEIQQFVSIR